MCLGGSSCIGKQHSLYYCSDVETTTTVILLFIDVIKEDRRHYFLGLPVNTMYVLAISEFKPYLHDAS